MFKNFIAYGSLMVEGIFNFKISSFKICVWWQFCRYAGVDVVENNHEGFISPTPTTTLDVWIRGESFWKELRMLGVEAIVVWTNS